MDMEKDNKKFWLGATLAILGVVLLFCGMYIEPKGEISGSVLGAVGEVFLLAGSLTAADTYITFKIKKLMDNK